MAASPRRMRALLALLALVAVVALALLPLLRRYMEEARRIERETTQRETQAKQAAQAQQAFVAVREAVAKNPNDVEARLRYAAYLGQGRRYQEALGELAAAARLAPNRAEPHLAMAEIYQSSNLLDMALEHQRQAVAREPDNPRALAQLGTSYIIFSWNRQALDLLTKAAERFPQDLAIRITLAQAYYQTQDYGRALKEIQAVKGLDPAAAALNNPLIDVYMQLNRPADAYQAAVTALQGDPANPAYLAGQARALRALGRYAEAILAAQSALRADPENLSARYELAMALKQSGKAGEALPEFRAIVAKNPLYQSASVLLAQMEAQQGNREEAARLRQQHLRLSADAQRAARWSLRVGNEPGDAEAHYQLGLAYVQQNRMPRAIVEFKEALRRKPADSRPRRPLADALNAMRRPQEAEAALKGG